MKTIPAALAFLITLIVGSIAWGLPDAGPLPEPPTEAGLNVAQQVLTWLSTVIVGLVGLVGTWLLLRGGAWLKAKTGMELASETQIQAWADHAIALAEEKSRALAKRGGAGIKGPEKMEIAMQFMIDRVKEHGIEKQAESKLRDYITARLGLAHAEEVGKVP